MNDDTTRRGTSCLWLDSKSRRRDPAAVRPPPRSDPSIDSNLARRERTSHLRGFVPVALASLRKRESRVDGRGWSTRDGLLDRLNESRWAGPDLSGYCFVFCLHRARRRLPCLRLLR
mmetsp:Transcript_10669/g.35330  ORF Transcript_10669/g.35330 Transcript_10669/m.35330 type:complete len:117 (-) Transcript_10669:256-606(-)